MFGSSSIAVALELCLLFTCLTWWRMGKKQTKQQKSRDPLTVPFRDLKRIAVSVDTLLRQKLGWPANTTLDNPLPVEPEVVRGFLVKVITRAKQ